LDLEIIRFTHGNNCRAGRSVAWEMGKLAPSFATARRVTGDEPASRDTVRSGSCGVMLMNRNRYRMSCFSSIGAEAASPLSKIGMLSDGPLKADEHDPILLRIEGLTRLEHND